MDITLGDFIRARRQDLGLSQQQLAERVSMTYSQADISRLERGFTELPRLETLSKLSEALEVPVGDLLIAAGWFDDGPCTLIPASSEAVDPNTLVVSVLNEIEAELETILDLEGEAKSRSDRLRSLIQELKTTSACSVTMSKHEEHGWRERSL